MERRGGKRDQRRPIVPGGRLSGSFGQARAQNLVIGCSSVGNSALRGVTFGGDAHRIAQFGGAGLILADLGETPRSDIAQQPAKHVAVEVSNRQRRVTQRVKTAPIGNLQCQIGAVNFGQRRANRRLTLPFAGIGQDRRRRRLRAAGESTSRRKRSASSGS